MKAVSIVGIILIAAGIGSLAYFASPMRLMLQETIILHKLNPIPPILGGVTLACGIALVYVGLHRIRNGGNNEG